MKQLRSAILEAVPSAQVEGAFFAEPSFMHVSYIYFLYNQERLEGERPSR